MKKFIIRKNALIVYYNVMNFVQLGENMNRGKSIATESGVRPREFMKWIEEMDEKLLNAMIEEARMGNRVDDSWIEENLSNLTIDVNKQMAEVNFNVNLILHKLEDKECSTPLNVW